MFHGGLKRRQFRDRRQILAQVVNVLSHERCQGIGMVNRYGNDGRFRAYFKSGHYAFLEYQQPLLEIGL